MTHINGPLLLLVAAVLAALIGFVNHRGGTCTVAAVCELVEGKPGRLIALAEAGLWAFALSVALKLAGFDLSAGSQVPVSPRALTGGLLLGLGAWFNKACLFGTLAQLGRRNANYLFTLVGLFVGFLAHAALAIAPTDTVPYQADPRLAVAAGVLFGASLLSVTWGSVRQNPSRPWQGLKLGHREAILIHALAFTLMASLAGAWTYGDLLSRYAHRSGSLNPLHLLLCVAVLIGALWGGWRTAQAESITLTKAASCLVGGALLAAGSALVPGGNDSLVLYGAPLLQGHALIALAVMVCTIGACVIGQTSLTTFWRKHTLG